MNSYRCETCKNVECEYHLSNSIFIDRADNRQKIYPGDQDVHDFTAEKGCASHSDLQITEPIKYGDRRTCEYQRVDTYPADEFVYCNSLDKCQFQCPSRTMDGLVFCDKPILSHDTDIVQTARREEREKVLDELIAHYKQVIHNGSGVTFNHPITYQWMYGGVVEYLEKLRQESKQEE